MVHALKTLEVGIARERYSKPLHGTRACEATTGIWARRKHAMGELGSSEGKKTLLRTTAEYEDIAVKILTAISWLFKR